MDFALPELGEGVYEAELVRWLVKPGDTVRRGQPLLEVLTDKATMEVPSPFAGTVTAFRGEPGAQVKVGDVVLTYEGGGAAATAEPAAVSAEKPAPAERGRHAQAARPNGSDVPVKAAPSVRYLARKLGIDLDRVNGSGPQGRILIEDPSPLGSPPPGPTRDA